jgi:hypothetical protein
LRRESLQDGVRVALTDVFSNIHETSMNIGDFYGLAFSHSFNPFA